LAPVEGGIAVATASAAQPNRFSSLAGGGERGGDVLGSVGTHDAAARAIAHAVSLDDLLLCPGPQRLRAPFPSARFIHYNLPAQPCAKQPASKFPFFARSSLSVPRMSSAVTPFRPPPCPSCPLWLLLSFLSAHLITRLSLQSDPEYRPRPLPRRRPTA